jgi:D-alanyl-D-alanine carboxypeptidase
MKTPIRVSDNLVTLANRVGAKMAAICAIPFVTILAAAPALASYASLIMDATSGRVLHETNADLTRYPASLTKMMTLYLLFEAVDNGSLAFDESLPVSEHAASQPPSKLGLKPGQSISVENAILGLVTKSANDVAAAVAERLGGSESRFAWLMTAKARQIGMFRTTFANASGLPDPDQVTSARDMAILALALLHDFPYYYHYFSTDHFYYGGAVHANHNRLLGAYEGLDGIKTGYTHSSGFNLVASAMRDGRRLIGVVLGARSPANRSLIMASLLDQAFGGGEIIEVQNEEPATPVQVQLAGLASSKAEMAAITPRALTRTALRSPPKVARRSTESRSRGSIKVASARASVRVAKSNRAPLASVVNVASMSKRSARVPVIVAQASVSGIERTVKTRANPEKNDVAAKPAPKARPGMPDKPMGSAARSRTQLKTTGVAPKPNRIVKASSAPDKSRLRVAQGGERRRPS